MDCHTYICTTYPTLTAPTSSDSWEACLTWPCVSHHMTSKPPSVLYLASYPFCVSVCMHVQAYASITCAHTSGDQDIHGGVAQGPFSLFPNRVSQCLDLTKEVGLAAQ